MNNENLQDLKNFLKYKNSRRLDCSFSLESLIETLVAVVVEQQEEIQKLKKS